MLDKSVHLMLVEDDEVDIETVRRSFDKNKVYNPLHIAKNGVEALDLLRGNGETEALHPRPQIILLDINMPKMNGIEFLQKIRQDDELKSLVVFVLTTSEADEDMVAAYDLNVAGYILKPVGFKDFIDSVHTLDLYWALIELPTV